MTHVIIGTAGHIDHGKTSLVKALTGQDTDRLKEEKERGISIELGFAWLDLSDGTRAGVVDVPGHERFIRTMLAGAHGIDLALFTVAADDGVMPQTEEHLDIVHLLGIERAIFVVTKIDLVPETRVREVIEDIGILISGTVLEGSPVVPYSFVTGQGLGEIRAQIEAILERRATRRAEGYFRLPVDRVFLLRGHGLIVTGTALGGEVRTGDRVRCLPGNQLFRVRSLQVHNQSMDVATRGQRVALNLSGLEKPAVERGHVICDERLTRATDRFDGVLQVPPGARTRIKNHQRVRVHLGTAERLATLTLLGGAESVGPKESAFCQLATSEPLVALRGDRFVVRNATAERTLGGGRVIHPWARRHARKEADLAHKLTVLSGNDDVALIELFLAEDEQFALPLAPVSQFLNQREAQVEAAIDRLDSVLAFSLEGETLYTTAAKYRQLTDALTGELRRFHAAHPLAPGMEMEEIRERLPGRVTTRLFRAVVERLEVEGAVIRDGNLLRLPSHTIRLEPAEQGLVEKVLALLGATPLSPPDVKQLVRETGADATKLGEVLRVMERQKAVVRVAPDLWFLAAAIDRVKADLHRHLSGHSDITAATFRDLFGTTRKYAIPLLEYLDREGITLRQGDTRRLKRPALVTND